MYSFHRLRRVLLLAFIALPSVAVLERALQVLLPTAADMTSTMGSLVYLIGFGLIYPLALQFLSNDRRATLIFFCVMGLTFLAFLAIYPLHDSGTLGFHSDRDEALDIGASRLLSLENPYICTAVSGVHQGCPTGGNPLAPLPGGFIFAAPFVLLFGLSAVQNLFWLPALFFQVRALLESNGTAAAVLTSLMLLNPVILGEMLSGGDHLANTIAVSIGLLGMLKSHSAARSVAWGCFLGVACAWRAHFLLAAIPCLTFYMARRQHSRILCVGGSAAVTFLALVLPVFLMGSSEFSPLQTQTKLEAFSHLLPHPTAWALIAATSYGLWAGWRANHISNLLIAVGITINIPVLIAVILHSLDAGALTLKFYGWYLVGGSLLMALGDGFRENAKKIDE